MINFVGLEAYLSVITYLATVIFPVGMVAWGSPRKDRFVFRCIASVAVMMIVTVSFTGLTQYIFLYREDWYGAIIYLQLLKFFAVFILSGAAVKICFQCDLWGALFCATAGYCVQHISARIDSVISDFLFPDLHWAVGMFNSIVIAAAVFVVFWLIVLRRQNKNMLIDIVNKWQVAIAFCVVSVNIFYNSFGLSYLTSIVVAMEEAGLDTSVVNYLRLFVYVMSALVALLALALDFGMSDRHRLSAEMQELKRILDESKRQYEYEKRNIEMINVKCHDLKHQLAALKGKIYEEQIEELQNTIDIYDSSIKTGNEALDVVLTQKSFYCKQHGIRLTCLLNGENYGFIARHELYALFNNALDNAIEAVEKVPEEKRVISVTEQSAVGFLTVRVQNYFEGRREFREGLPVSEKDRKEHGYGMKSMKLIAEKYGGGISASCDGDCFYLDLFFRK